MKLSLFLALAAENAFNRMHWGNLSQTLLKFCFSDFIHSAIVFLYMTPSAQAYTSGMLSTSFHLTNGTQQGMPSLSTDIFFSYRTFSRSHPLVHCIRIGEREHKLGLFGDEIILTLSNPETSLRSIVHLNRVWEFFLLQTEYHKMFCLTHSYSTEIKGLQYNCYHRSTYLPTVPDSV